MTSASTRRTRRSLMRRFSRSWSSLFQGTLATRTRTRRRRSRLRRRVRRRRPKSKETTQSCLGLRIMGTCQCRPMGIAFSIVAISACQTGKCSIVRKGPSKRIVCRPRLDTGSMFIAHKSIQKYIMIIGTGRLLLILTLCWIVYGMDTSQSERVQLIIGA